MSLMCSCALVLFKVYDQFEFENFRESPLTNFLYEAALGFFSMQVIFAVSVYADKNFPNEVDMDLLSCSVFFLALKLYYNVRKRKLSNYYKKNVSTLSVLRIDSIGQKTPPSGQNLENSAEVL